MTHRRARIVATLGPASADPAVVRAMVEAGMDVARINASHGDHSAQAALIRTLRAAATHAGRPVGVLYDLQGPKIRVGRFDGPARAVRAGDHLTFAVGRATEADELPSDYDALDRDVRPGDPLLIDDGAIATEVTDVAPGRVRCRVLDDGLIHPRKGINLPATVLSTPTLTDRDRAAAAFAVGEGVDVVALSFVRRAQDVEDLRAALRELGAPHLPVVAKIEKPEALGDLDAILDASWGVMVARGDLGVELPPEAVPPAQKRIVREAGRRGRPVITATQMLDSMQRQPRPTRAEASDVANAVLDGTDAVMLSGETAIGRYPVESVAMMARIIESAEGHAPEPPGSGQLPVDTVPGRVADAACHVADRLGARRIVAFTMTGATAILVSQRRPRVPILAFSPSEPVRRRLALVWGLSCWTLPAAATVDERVRLLDDAVLTNGLASDGDTLVICMGAPSAPDGSTNVVMVHRVGEAELGG